MLSKDYSEISVAYILSEDKRYDLFKSEVCHFIKYNGKRAFVEIVLHYNMVQYFYEIKQYAKAFYLLAIFDYFTDEKNIKRLPDYEVYRQQSLEDYLYPADVELIAKVNGDAIKKQVFEECSNSPMGKYFLKYKLIEKGIDDIA